MTELEAELLAAHEAGDSKRLVALYAQASRQANSDEAAGFYLTHALVFALETGHPDAHAIRANLIASGRESPLHPPSPPLR